MFTRFCLVLCLLLSACTASPPPEPQSSPSPALPEPRPSVPPESRIQAAVAKANQGSGEGQHFTGRSYEVLLSDFEFTPAHLRFPLGEVVRVRLINTALVTHYFGGEAFFREAAVALDLFGSKIPPRLHHIPVAPLDHRDLYLYLHKAGRYPLSCFVPNHRKAGMTGILEVMPEDG